VLCAVISFFNEIGICNCALQGRDCKGPGIFRWSLGNLQICSLDAFKKLLVCILTSFDLFCPVSKSKSVFMDSASTTPSEPSPSDHREIFHWTKTKKSCRGRQEQNQLLVECIRGQKIDQSPCQFFSPKAWPCEILRDNAESLNLAQHPVKLCRLSRMVQNEFETSWQVCYMFRDINSEQVSIERCFG